MSVEDPQGYRNPEKQKEEKVTEVKKAWDADTMGFGKHSFHHIDPATINPADYAKNLHGEEQNFGDVRQYNSADNEKHPECTLDLDWVSRVGTIFKTEAAGYEGIWHVTNVPTIKEGVICCRATKVAAVEEEPTGEEMSIPTVELGICQGVNNLFKQVKSETLKRGSVTRTQRIKLTKRN